MLCLAVVSILSMNIAVHENDWMTYYYTSGLFQPVSHEPDISPLWFFSNFHHLLVLIKEGIPENFSFVDVFVSIIWSFEKDFHAQYFLVLKIFPICIKMNIIKNFSSQDKRLCAVWMWIFTTPSSFGLRTSHVKHTLHCVKIIWTCSFIF